MLSVKDIPHKCPVCNAVVIIDENEIYCPSYATGLCIFRGTLKSECKGYSYLQFQFEELHSAMNFNYNDNEINLHIHAGGEHFTINLPLDLNPNDYFLWKDDIIKKIKKFRNFV